MFVTRSVPIPFRVIGISAGSSGAYCLKLADQSFPMPELKEARLDIPPPLEYGLDSESVKRERGARYRFKSGEDPIKVLHLADL